MNDDYASSHRLIDLANAIERSLKRVRDIPATKLSTDRFRTNAERIAATASMPYRLIGDYTIAGHIMSVAIRKATNGREWNYHRLTRSQHRLVAKHYKQLQDELRDNPGKVRRIARGMTLSPAKQAFNRIMAGAMPDRKIAINAVMASIIVGAWTTFEALAEDLWVAALNAKPILGLTALDAEIKESDKAEDKARKQAIFVSLPVWLAVKPDYKICDHMGDLLRDYRRDWARRDNAQKSYEKVFAASKTGIRAIFQNPALKWLNATRNVIVHNGSVADNEFRTLVEDHPRLNRIAENEQIPINGAITHELSMAAIKSCIQLLDFVGQQLKNDLNESADAS